MDNVFSLKRVRRTMASLSLAALIASFFAIGVAQAQTFPDVNPSDWFYSYTEDLVTLGVVNSSMPEYRPADNVNRAETTKLVVEAFDIPLESPETSTFSDVAPGTWYYEYVETAAAHGIVSGYMREGVPTGYFGPGDDLTRGQAAKVFVLGAPLDENTLCGPTFPDVGIGEWFYPYVETLYVNSVVDGNPDGSYGPMDNINRAEIAKIVSNTMAPVVRPCGGFSVNSATPLSDTTLEVCYTQSYDDVSGLMSENYAVEDLDGNPLAVSMAEATSDPMCVLLTTDPQDSSKVYDLTVSGVTSADGMPLVGDMGSFSGYTVGATGDLEVRIDGSTPSSQDIPNNGANILYSVFAFQAGPDEGVRVEELILTRQGLGLPADFDAVRLYVNDVQVGSEKTINTSSNSATFSLSGDPINVPPGSTVLVEARGDMAGQDNSQNSLCIVSSDDVLAYGATTDTALPVGGAFSVCGEHMTTTSASVGEITYEIDDYTGDITVGDMDNSLARLKLDVDNTEDVDVERVSFKQRGSADPEDFANPTLWLSGSPLDVPFAWEGDFLTFDLSADPLFIERGNSRTLELRADIVGGLGNNVMFDIYRDWHVEGTGRVYGYGVNVVETGAPPALVARDIIGGNLSFALSANNPVVGDVASGAEDHRFMAFNLSTGGDGVTIRQVTVEVNYGICLLGNANNLQDVKIWTENSVGDLIVVAGPLDPGNDPLCTAPLLDLVFNDSFDQQAGVTKEYFVTADVENAAPDGNTFLLELDTTVVDAEYLSNGDTVMVADISGGNLIGKMQTVADPTLDVTLALVPSDQNIVGGQLDVQAVGWSVQASSASDLKVNSVVVSCDWTDNAGPAGSCADVFSNAAMYQQEGSTLTLLQGGESFSSGAEDGTATFNSLNLDIPAGNAVKLVLRFNTSNSATGTDTAAFDIAVVGDMIVEDSQFNTLAAGQKTTDSLPRTLTFQTAGTLTVSLSGSSPTDDALLAGSLDNKVTTVKLASNENEDITVEKLRVHNLAVAGEDEPISQVHLYNGGDLLGSALINGASEAEFTGLSVLVPADGQTLLDLVVDTNLVGSGSATTGDNFNMDLDSLNDAFVYEDNNGLDIKATGNSSGELVTIVDGFTASTPGNFIVYNTLPSISRTSGSPTSGGGTSVSMLEFDLAVEGNGSDSGILTDMTVSFSGTCVAKPTTFTLFRGNTEIGDAGGASLQLVAAEFTNGIGEEVAVGNSSTLNIHADTSGCLVDTTLGVNIDAFIFNDGDALYTANIANNFLNFDLSPYPVAGHLFSL